MRDFGFGKSTLEGTINIEVENFLKILKPFKMDYAINVASVNIIWGLMAGTVFFLKKFIL